MTDCAKCRRFAAPAAAGVLKPKAEARFRRHLASCPACAAEFREMETTVNLMKRRERFDPGAEFWDGYWDRLARRMDAEEAAGRRAAPAGRLAGRPAARIPRWAFQAAAGFLILAAGITLGRIWTRTPAPAPETAGKPGPSIVAAGSLSSDVLGYIGRSKTILLALANFDRAADDPHALSLEHQKRVSGELVRESGPLRARLDAAGEKRLRKLVSDLEVILTQISNLDPEENVEAVEFVKDGILERGILFKIRIAEIGAASRPPAGTASKPSL